MQTDITNQSAEDRFLAWVLRLDSPADMAEAAKREIARLDRDHAADDESLRLRAFLLQAVAFQPHAPRARRRHLH